MRSTVPALRLAVGVVAVLLAGVGLWGCFGLSLEDLLSLPPAQLLPADGSVPLISIQVDAEQEDTAGLKRITDTLEARGIPATVFVTADYANRNATLVHNIYAAGFEVALHGYYTGEQLISMTYEEQKDLLTRALTALKGCKPCGTSHAITGFRPQYFSQNEDTYRVLDELGFTYDSGFKVGQLSIPGHEQNVTPYTVANHQFRAVPLTTLTFEGQDIYLCDIACAQVQKLTASQWLAALRQGLQQCVERNEPLVVLVHGWYTGDTEQYDYWLPFLVFLNEASRQGAFVTTQELVDFYAK